MGMLQTWILVAGGGAIGSLARLLLATALDGRLGGLPIGTLAVNLLGCLLIGVAAGFSDRPWVRPLVMTGLLGGFTTFSAFGLQSLDLLQRGRPLAAAGYIAASLAGGLLAVWAGAILGRALAAR